MGSPFDVLRIDSDADEDEIERAYRRRLKETHPDHGGSADAFLAVRAAYEEIRSGRRSSGQEANDGERHETAGDRFDDSTRDRSGESESYRRNESRVEYLDYEVLDDFGWDVRDERLFEKASAEGLDPEDHGRILVRPDESVLEAAENRGFPWPYACRGGACANCAVAVTEGEVSMPENHILPPEMIERGIRLSCVGAPTTDEVKVVYNVKHLPDLDELRLPPGPFDLARGAD